MFVGVFVCLFIGSRNEKRSLTVDVLKRDTLACFWVREITKHSLKSYKSFSVVNFQGFLFLDTLGYGCVGWGQERTHGGGGPIGVYSSEAYDGSVMMEQSKGKCNLSKD